MTSNPKTLLESETIPRVEIDFMNNTHFEEIDMVKSLGEQITAYQENDVKDDNDANAISESLQAWLDHTEAHFERENELMLETQFPVYDVHRQEHTRALSEMTATVENWKENKDIEAIAEYIFSLWPNWFSGHVNTMDMMTAKFAVMNGYTAS